MKISTIILIIIFLLISFVCKGQIYYNDKYISDTTTIKRTNIFYSNKHVPKVTSVLYIPYKYEYISQEYYPYYNYGKYTPYIGITSSRFINWYKWTKRKNQ